jgi:hypothetical protein
MASLRARLIALAEVMTKDKSSCEENCEMALTFLKQGQRFDI